jgi:hypothetical protein
MFSVLSSLRAAQLVRGCVPRVVVGTQKLIAMAQMEVAEAKVAQSAPAPALSPRAVASDAR